MEVYTVSCEDNTPEREEMSVGELRAQLQEWDEDVFRMERRMRSVLRTETRAHAMVAGFLHEVYALALRFDRNEFWKTREQWQQEYGFTRHNVRTAERVLGQEGLGVIRTRHGVGNRSYYELLPARFLQTFYDDRDDAFSQPSTTGSDVRVPANRCTGSGEQKAGLQRSHILDNEETYKKESEWCAADATPPAHEREKVEEVRGEARSDHEPEVVDDPSNDVGGDRGAGRGNEPSNGGGDKAERLRQHGELVVNKIDAGLRERYGDALSEDQRAAYRRQAEDLALKVAEEEASREDCVALWKRIVAHVVDLWPRRGYVPLKTVLAVLRPTTPEAVVLALEERLVEEHGDSGRLFEGQRAAYLQGARELLEDEQTDDEMVRRVLDRVVCRWPRYKNMPLLTALDDVEQGLDRRGSNGPPNDGRIPTREHY